MYIGKITSQTFAELAKDCLFVLLNYYKFKPKIVEMACTVMKKIAKTENGNLVFLDNNHIGTILNLTMSKTIELDVRLSMVYV